MASQNSAVNAEEQFAIEIRNAGWRENPRIPSWVDVDSVGLDRFFTRPEIAQRCHESLLRFMHKDGAPIDDYGFVEPGAGSGAFFDLLPSERRVGIDLIPLRSDFVCADFLSWQPAKPQRVAVIGNPPFGYRAWLALTFVNHAAQFADYVGMILPMAFQSDGKGSPKNRVVGLRLLHSETLPPDSFTDAAGQPVKINALWQVWQRGVNNPRRTSTCNNWLDLFTVDMRKERLCGQERMREADWFLQRTFYGTASPRLVRDFMDVRYVCGYGLVMKQNKQELTDLLNATDWTRYSNLAAHNCRHISMYHIRDAVIDAGFVDGRR